MKLHVNPSRNIDRFLGTDFIVLITIFLVLLLTIESIAPRCDQEQGSCRHNPRGNKLGEIYSELMSMGHVSIRTLGNKHSSRRFKTVILKFA